MDNIKQMRKERGLSQTELANMLGVTRQTVSTWERGTNIPTAENMVKLQQMGVNAQTISQQGFNDAMRSYQELLASMRRLHQEAARVLGEVSHG